MKDYLTVQEMSEQWKLNPRTIQMMCADGKIPGAFKFGRSWAIPSNAVKPSDGREKSGQYKNWRKSTVTLESNNPMEKLR